MNFILYTQIIFGYLFFKNKTSLKLVLLKM